MSKNYKYGFIGAGNMGSAMISGILEGGLAEKKDITFVTASSRSAKNIEDRFGIEASKDATSLASNSSVIILAVKPKQLDDVLPEIRESLDADSIVISVAAGKSISDIDSALLSIAVAGKLKVARAMPNTPAAVGEAMSAVCFNDRFEDTEKEEVLSVFRSFGKAEEVDEGLMDTVTGLSGSSPAFIYMLIEAMADEAVKCGMKRESAYTFAAQTVKGAADMVLKTGKHPGELKDQVTSPGGTTIAGVLALEKNGFRSAVTEGIDAAVKRSIELSSD
ncbi:MAG: pyrroline-5-carboxylate reductase [Lachnospiraceae bacterium]|nr:pyrroline-5-carboxylate reductase [Lachnospiraceae bacterium]